MTPAGASTGSQRFDAVWHALLLFAMFCVGGRTHASQADGIELHGIADISLVKSANRAWSVNADRDNMIGLRASETLTPGTVIGAEIEIKMRRRFGTVDGPTDVVAVDGLLHLKGEWGRVKIGRAFTAAQDALYAFEPFAFRTVGSLLAITGNYASDPVLGGSAAYQFGRAIHYESPSMADIQAALSLADRSTDAGPSIGPRQKLPYSVAMSFNGQKMQAMLGMERGLSGDRFDNVSASVPIGTTRWMMTVGRYKPVSGGSELSFAGGGILQASASTTLRFGLGAVSTPAGVSMRQWSVGYWMKPSKAVTFYADASVFPRRSGEARQSTAVFDIGVRYVFRSGATSGNQE